MNRIVKMRKIIRLRVEDYWHSNHLCESHQSHVIPEASKFPAMSHPEHEQPHFVKPINHHVNNDVEHHPSRKQRCCVQNGRHCLRPKPSSLKTGYSIQRSNSRRSRPSLRSFLLPHRSHFPRPSLSLRTRLHAPHRRLFRHPRPAWLPLHPTPPYPPRHRQSPGIR